MKLYRIFFLLALLLTLVSVSRAQLVLTTSPAGGVIAPIDGNGWHNFKVPVSQNITSFTMQGTPAPSQAQITVIFTENAIGGFSVNFGAGISNACTVTTTPNATSLCQFNYDGTSGTWIGIGGGTGSFISINKRLFVDQLAGATADAKLASCFSLLPSGGTCDATGFASTTQTIAATVTVPSNVTVLFDPATVFQPGTSSVNLFVFEPTSVIRGFNLDCTNQPAWSGIMFQNDTGQLYWGGTAVTELGNISSRFSCVNAPGTPLVLNSTSTAFQVQFLDIHDWRVYTGGTNGFLLTASGTGFVNGNHFNNIVWTGTHIGLHMTTSAAGAGVNGNLCFECSMQSQHSTDIAWVIDGSAGQVAENQYFGGMWDSLTTNVSITNTGAFSNAFFGFASGTGAITDTSGHANSFYSNGFFQGIFALNGASTVGFGTASGDVVVPNGGCYRSAISTNSSAVQLACLSTDGNNVVLIDPNAQGTRMGGPVVVAAGLQQTAVTNGKGLQVFNTATTCTTAAAVGATCTTAAITLPVAELDTSYRTVCTGKGLTNVPVVVATTNSSATQFTITIAALTAAAASFASFDCQVSHN